MSDNCIFQKGIVMESTGRISNKETFFIGLMLFSLFFGAGNLIFPPELGLNAGEHAWPAIIGFLISGVGLPILGVLAITYIGSSDAEGLSRRVHSKFAVAITTLSYLTIGPLFAVPRTGTVSYEMAIVPFLKDGGSSLSLLVFTLIYFAIVYALALNPGKFVDRIGKIITPFLLLVIFILLAAAVFGPLGTYQAPTEAYTNYPLFKGITEGYLTMDTIASVVFGIIVVKAIEDRGAKDRLMIQKTAWKAGLVAGICLGVVYAGLGYLGATSATAISAQTGHEILAAVSNAYFGVYGNVILGLAILFACIPTATGLISSCAIYINRRFPRLSYPLLVLLFTLLSLVIANFGLENVISLSVPVLHFIYPIIMVLIFLAFLDKMIGERRSIYQFAVLFTGIVSLNDGLLAANPDWGYPGFLALPFAELGLAWVVPALLGAVIGFVVSLFQK